MRGGLTRDESNWPKQNPAILANAERARSPEKYATRMNMLSKIGHGLVNGAKRVGNFVVEVAKPIVAAVAVGVGVLSTAVSEAQAAVPTEITDITTNADTVWTTVKGTVLAVVGTLILIGFVKMIRKR